MISLKKALLFILFLALFGSLFSPMDMRCWGDGSTTDEISVLTPDTPAASGSGANTQSLLPVTLKMIAALSLVVGLMLILIVWLKKIGLGFSRQSSTSLIKVLDTRMIAPKKYISIVAVGKQIVVLGITDQSVNLLTTLEEYETGDTDLQRKVRPFAEFLNKASAVIRGRCNDTGRG